MKIIDLLNNIANGKKVPAKIKFKNNIFRYSGCNYYCDEMMTTLFNIYSLSILNENVEIIEDKKIGYIEGRIKNWKHYIEDRCFRVQPLEDLELNQNEIVIIDKVNELIDKVNELEEK